MILAAVLVLAMTATTFLTQRQLMSKNMPADALTGPYAQQQKMLLYVLPARLRRRRHRLPDRRPPLLDHLEPVDDGPAVLRDPQQPGAEHRGLPGQGAARRGEAQAQGRCPRSTSHGDVGDSSDAAAEPTQAAPAPAAEEAVPLAAQEGRRPSRPAAASGRPSKSPPRPPSDRGRQPMSPTRRSPSSKGETSE